MVNKIFCLIVLLYLLELMVKFNLWSGVPTFCSITNSLQHLAVSFGFRSVEEYYSKSSSSDSIKHVCTPLLCIQVIIPYLEIIVVVYFFFHSFGMDNFR